MTADTVLAAVLLAVTPFGVWLTVRTGHRSRGTRPRRQENHPMTCEGGE